MAAILFLAHRWEEVEKQSLRVKGLEVSAGHRGRNTVNSLCEGFQSDIKHHVVC